MRNLLWKKGRVETFVDNVRSNIVGVGNVGKKDSDLIVDVHLVEGLKHNLLSISQFRDKGYWFFFFFFLTFLLYCKGLYIS